MKIVTWNCAMALQKKFQRLLTLEADILIVQECSQAFIKQMNRLDGWSCFWRGRNLSKGLGVLVRDPWSIRKSYWLRPKWAAKLVIDGPTCIELFPVWACKSIRPAAEYIEQVHLLLDVIERAPVAPLAIVAGDFNSNSRWDSDYRLSSHSAAVDRFRMLGFESAYHKFFAEQQGSEKRPTYWFRKDKVRPYHIDYAFISHVLAPKVRSVRVGSRANWLSLSDHAPVLVEIDM